MRLLLIDEGFIGSVYTAVGLAEAGCDVTLMGAVGGHSTVHRGRLTCTLGPRPADSAFLPFLQHHCNHHRYDFVLPCTEPLLHLLHAHPDTLPPLFPHVTALLLQLLADKFLLSACVARAGVPVPAQRMVASAADVSDAFDELGSPLVLKGTAGRGGDTVRIVRTRAAATSHHQALGRRGVGAIAQQYLRGSTWLVGGLFRDGTPLRLYAARKLRQQPPATGPAVELETTRAQPLLDVALDVFARLRWTGLASADFIDDGAGTFHFLELNPRPWGSIAAAAEAGVELFAPLAALLRGEHVAADLHCAPSRARVLPLYLMQRSFQRDPHTLLHLARDLAGAQGRVWRDLPLAAHLAVRLRRVRQNWPNLSDTRGAATP